MDMDDLLADFSDEEEDSIAGKARKSAPKQQKEDTTVKKQRSIEDMPQKPAEPEGTKNTNTNSHKNVMNFSIKDCLVQILIRKIFYSSQCLAWSFYICIYLAQFAL
jgi:hypothetical protein